MYKEVVSDYLQNGSNFIHVFWMHQRHLIVFILEKYSLFLLKGMFTYVSYVLYWMLSLHKTTVLCVMEIFFSKYVSNGVKQGGVLSPPLFSIYIYKLLFKLKKSRYGCHLKGIYMGAFAYVDDITITCSSRCGLHKMLVLCNNFRN